MNILLTGSEGYIGTILAARLAAAGHKLTCYDTGFYTDGKLYELETSAPDAIKKDIRDMTLEDIKGHDAIVHLAELSNDPLGQNNPEITYNINHKGSLHLAALAKEAGIERFVYTSSCSIYGVADGVVDETSQINPQTAYAECKAYVERDVSAMADDSFSPTFLRNATVYGPSPRQRFDLVVNDLCGLAWTTKKIAMISDGSPWRPLVHIDDVCLAIQCVLEAEKELVHNQIFNVGRSDGNYRIREVAEIVGAVFPGCEVSFGKATGADTRSYQVNFDKIANTLSSFKPQYTVKDGAMQLKAIFEKINMSEETFKYRNYTRLKQLEYLIDTEKVTEDLHWK